MGGLYSLTLQGNQVGFTTLTGIKAACDARRRHDQVPQAVQEEIFELQPVVPELEVTSAQLSVESLYDQRAIEEIAQLEAELARVQEEIQKAVAESDARFKKLLDDEAKALEEAQVKARDPLPLLSFLPSHTLLPPSPGSLPLLAPSLDRFLPLPSVCLPPSFSSLVRSFARSLSSRSARPLFQLLPSVRSFPLHAPFHPRLLCDPFSIPMHAPAALPSGREGLLLSGIGLSGCEGRA